MNGDEEGMQMPTFDNGPIPEKLLEDGDFPWRVRTEAMAQMMSDEPSQSDMRRVFVDYLKASPAERDAMNAAFVWMTGYTLQSLAARAEAGSRGDWTRVVSRWNRGRPSGK
jgi:GrpB-like predicted nucleotidyltransferase (UPF0157 family)